MPTIDVCAGCGNAFCAHDKDGKPSCPICWGTSPLSGQVRKVDLPEKLKCPSCGVEKSTAELLKKWTKIPFVNPARGEYYCGCRGWD